MSKIEELLRLRKRSEEEVRVSKDIVIYANHMEGITINREGRNSNHMNLTLSEFKQLHKAMGELL